MEKKKTEQREAADVLSSIGSFALAAAAAQAPRKTGNSESMQENTAAAAATENIDGISRGFFREEAAAPQRVDAQEGGLFMEEAAAAPVPAEVCQTPELPAIPAIAQGTVLPKSRPFLTLAEHETHGQVSLNTMQEAVALVMEDYASANLAGQEAIVSVLRQILTAVLGIELGDDVLGRAVRRYERKMAMVKGDL